MSEPVTVMRSDAQRGKDAALLVAENWPHPDGLIERATAEFANAAVERLAELIAEQRLCSRPADADTRRARRA